MQVSGDDTTVIQAVLACDTERTQLLKEEQSLLTQLNKPASATANGHAATANGTASLPNGGSATAGAGSATPGADAQLSNGTKGDEANGKADGGKAADAAESKAAAQLAQVCTVACS